MALDGMGNQHCQWLADARFPVRGIAQPRCIVDAVAVAVQTLVCEYRFTPLQGRRIGLYHVGWKIGDGLDALKHARDRITELGYTIDGASDHTVSQSLYLRDPDGNEVELFVDDPGIDWRRDRSWMTAPVKPLDLPED